ncbi:hypothetical protein NDA03_25900 [Trichocoleus sp. Lan]|uniref:hypothetical protein n=1 Tax=Trichocoleus sp. Lan TaxID=2933927 RepID=UPI0032978321
MKITDIEDNSLFSELTVEETADITGGGFSPQGLWTAGLTGTGAALGGIGGTKVAGPVGGGIGGALGAELGKQASQSSTASGAIIGSIVGGPVGTVVGGLIGALW